MLIDKMESIAERRMKGGDCAVVISDDSDFAEQCRRMRFLYALRVVHVRSGRWTSGGGGGELSRAASESLCFRDLIRGVPRQFGEDPPCETVC